MLSESFKSHSALTPNDRVVSIALMKQLMQELISQVQPLQAAQDASHQRTRDQ